MSLHTIEIGKIANAPGVLFIGSISYAQDASGSDTYNLPSGVREGDLIICIRANDLTDAGWNTPTNYTQLVANTAGCYYQIAYNLLAAAEDTIDIDNASTAVKSAIILLAFRGVDQATPIDAVCAAQGSGTGSDPDPPSVTTVTNGAIVVAVGFMDDDNITSCSGPSGYSNTIFKAAGDAVDSSCSNMAATKKVTSAGAEDPAVFATDGDDAWLSYTLAVRPA